MSRHKWQSIEGLEGMAEQLTLNIDNIMGEYTRLTRFFPGADITLSGAKSHSYPEEIFIISDRLFDHAFDMWLGAGHYTSRPAGEVYGPFVFDAGCVVLGISFPKRPV